MIAHQQIRKKRYLWNDVLPKVYPFKSGNFISAKLLGFFPLAWTGFESDAGDTNTGASPDTTEVKNKTSASCPSTPLLHQSHKNNKYGFWKDFHKWREDLPVLVWRKKIKPKPFLMAKGSRGKFRSEETSGGHLSQPPSCLKWSLPF